MDVVVEHFRDAGEQDANGKWDYYYEGDLYTFMAGALTREATLKARIYTDTPKRASFIEHRDRLQASPTTPDAVEYLRARGVTEIHCLGPVGYAIWWCAE